jgi:hypothetical protein
LLRHFMPSALLIEMSMSYSQGSQFSSLSYWSGKKIVSCSICGSELCCEWKDSSTSWQKLLSLNESHPLQVDEFAFASQLLMNQPLTGGWAGSSRRETTLSPWLSAKVLYTANIPIIMGLNTPKLLKTLPPSTKPLIQPFGGMRLKRRWKIYYIDILGDGVAPPSDYH